MTRVTKVTRLKRAFDLKIVPKDTFSDKMWDKVTKHSQPRRDNDKRVSIFKNNETTGG